ncbi:MAG: isopentenyl-diphosphate delta-isomerase, partial [Saprospiraceae bacterium]
IMRLLDVADYPIIVKEVGQGFGYHSLRTLLQLPIQAIDFAANGGTNFAKLELLRSDSAKQSIYGQLAHVGHSAEDMVNITNRLLGELGDKVRCQDIIVSGGIHSFLDGYFLTEKLNTKAIYGQASAFLKQAMGDYETLHHYVDAQIQGLELANAFLKIKE